MDNNLLIIGVGFMGGSFALALKSAGFKGNIYGVDIDRETIKKACMLGVIEKGWDNLEDAKGLKLDMVVLATPVRVFRKLASQISLLLHEDTVITDLGSVKGKLVYELEEVLGSRYVGGHPIAGTEKSGVEHSFPELFSGKRVILTPTDRTDREAFSKVREVWESVGASVELMEPFLHDWVFGAVSHLPHAVAFALIDTLIEMSTEIDLFRYPGAGFKDFTRIAGSDPVMWRDIFLENKENVIKAIDTYISSLEKLKNLISSEEEETLTEFLREARDRRLSIE